MKQSPSEYQYQLVIPRSEAERLMVKTIEKGTELRDRRIPSKHILKQTRESFKQWDDYNEELLGRIFSNSYLAEDYSKSTAGFAFFGDVPFNEYVDEFHHDISFKINKINSILGRLDLIPEEVLIAAEEVKNGAQSVRVNVYQSKPGPNKKVFIVHGHDDAAKFETARFIEKIGLQAIILHEQASSGKTIIEKIERHSDVGFGVVLYTPCDIGGPIKAKNFLERARQNVVFEHGYLIGRLGRDKVCALVKGELETPGDIGGVVYVPMIDGRWQVDLAKELREAGYEVDMNDVV